MRIPSSPSLPPSAYRAGQAEQAAATAIPRSTTPFVPITPSKPEDAPEPTSGASRTRTTGRDRASAIESFRGFSVLNDFRYLTDSDKTMLAEVTGEKIDPDFTNRPGSASAFGLQLALDRRTGELAPNQEVTSVYLRNAAAALDARNAGRAGFTNPYSGEVMDKAIAWLDAHGRNRADIRL